MSGKQKEFLLSLSSVGETSLKGSNERKDNRRTLTGRLLPHIRTCMITRRVTTCYILFVICTHTYRDREREREREESSELRCDFVPVLNLQWDSTESPFTYTYVINTTYYSSSGSHSDNGTRMIMTSK